MVRTQGNLRVVLNTKLWPQMTVEKANEKSLRVTAIETDSSDIKIYLIMVCHGLTMPWISGDGGGGEEILYRVRNYDTPF